MLQAYKTLHGGGNPQDNDKSNVSLNLGNSSAGNPVKGDTNEPKGGDQSGDNRTDEERDRQFNDYKQGRGK